MPGITHFVLNRAALRSCAVPVLLMALLAGCSTPGPYVAGQPQLEREPEPQAPVVTAQMAQAQETLGKMVMLQDRLYKVAAPLLINNADLCKTQARNLLGFTAKNKYSYPGDYALAAQSVLGYGEHLEVSGVLSGSGAARAGLRKGDVLLAAEGKTLPSGPNAETQAAGILGPLVASRAALNMSISRGDNSQTLNVPVTRACAFRVDLGNADNVNSYADGQRIMVTRGMINFAQSDEAIAFVMAKDMAHNVLEHARTQRSSATIGSIIDNLSSVRPDLSMLVGSGGLRAMPPELDAAADSLALYMLARAGYNIDNAARFWQKLATQYPASVLNGYTANHPGTAIRLAVIGKTVAEIKAKQAARKPLKP